MKKIEEREAFAFASAFVGDWCLVVCGVESAIVGFDFCASERDGEKRETTVFSESLVRFDYCGDKQH